MRDFFHGWRRKVGCITLVMALCSLVILIRSHVIMDVLTVYAIEIESIDGLIEVSLNYSGHSDDAGIIHQSVPNLLLWESIVLWENPPTFGIARLQPGGPNSFNSTTILLKCSILWFTLPLTLLTTYLLLRKPRPKESRDE